MANEIITNEYDNKNQLKYLDKLKLKKYLMITLVSLIAENKSQKIVELMISSLKIENILKRLLEMLPSQEIKNALYIQFVEVIKYYYNNNFLINNNTKQQINQINEDELVTIEKITTILEDEKNNKKFYSNPNLVDENMLEKVLKERDDLAFQYYTLLKILSESEKIEIKNIKGMLNEKKQDLNIMEEKIGSIEIVRDGELDIVYFPKVEQTKYLREQTITRFQERFFNILIIDVH
jgi:hypothetical protein